MATYLENLTTARDNIAARLAEITAQPKPSYDVDGQRVEWNDYFKALTDQMDKLTTAINGASIYEEESIGYS